MDRAVLSLQNLVPGQSCACVLRDGRTPKAELPPPLVSGSGLVLIPGPCPWTVPSTFSTSVCASIKWTGGLTDRTHLL